MLKSPLPGRAARRTGAVVAVFACAGAATLAWASQPAPGRPGEAQEVRASVPLPPAPPAAAALSQPIQLAQATSPKAAAPAKPDAPHRVAAPDWVTKPNGGDVARVYPKADLDKRGGAAVLDCRFAGDGRLAARKVASETPPAEGFGAAALALAPLFQAKPLDRNGATVAGGAIRIPIRFLPAAGSIPALAGAPAMIRQPDWIDKPVGADLAHLYPAEARKQNFEGTTVLSCGVDKEGRLTGCTATGIMTFGAPEAIREDFRKATLELAGLFRMQPQTVDGVPTADGRINIPIRWSLPTDPAAAARLDGLRDPGPSAPR